MSIGTDDNNSQEENEDTSSDEAPIVRTFKFPAHQSSTLSLAKMCRDNKTFTDCTIQCDSGVKLKGHRLVLGAASPFMKIVFDEVPPSLNEATVMVPGVKVDVVRALMDFLYTGEMTVKREDTIDLQLLIDTLRIDPSLITVNRGRRRPDEEDKENEEEPEANSSSHLKRKIDEDGDDKGSDESKRLRS